MANNENLMQFRSSTPEERRRNASKAGKASGAARRKKANFRKILNALLTAEIDNEEWTPVLEALGIDSTLEAAINAAMIREALSGNVKAYIAIRDTLGQTTKSEEDLEEQKIRTDRAKRARDQEVGNTDNSEENIKNFLNAVKPSDEEMAALFDSEEERENTENTEKTSKI